MTKARKTSVGNTAEKTIPNMADTRFVTTEVVDKITVTTEQATDIIIQPRTIFVDRLAGTVVFDQLFCKEANMNLMVRAFREDGRTPERIGEFYRSLRLGKVMVGLMAAGFVRAADIQFTVLELVDALQKDGNVAPRDAVLIADHLVPVLLNAGFNVKIPERYATRTEHQRRLVTIVDLKNDVAAQNCEAVVSKARVASLGTNRYAAKVLAETVAVDLRSIGSRMLALATYSKVFDDSVIAVRAHLDRANDSYAGIPDWLRDHSVIADFATNLTFINAAFDPTMPREPVLQVGETDMKKMLDGLAATLKSGQRYQNVSLKALTAELTLAHGFDYNDDLAFATLTHNVKYEPGIITALPTIEGKELAYLDHIDSHVAELLMSHDHNMFSMKRAEQAVFAANCNAVNDPELWAEGTPPYVETLTAFVEYLSPALLVALTTAERVCIRATFDDEKRISYLKSVEENGITAYVPDFVFSVRNDGKRLPAVLRVQMLDKNYIVTQDAALAVLASRSFEATAERLNADQLPNESAFGAHLLAVDANITQKINQGLDYHMTVGAAALKGKLFLKQLDSLRSVSAQVVLVNQANVKMVTAIMTAFIYGLQDGTNLKSKMVHNGSIYNAILDMAENLSSNFREEVHMKIVDHALTGVTPDQSIAMRSTYNRSMFAIQVDVFALRLYLLAIGAVMAADIVNAMSDDDGFQLAMSQRGSRRVEKNKAC